MISQHFALENPFTSMVHPQAEALHSYGRTWVQKVGLVQADADLERFDSALYWQLITQAYPTVPWEVLTIAHDWNVWGFFLDDVDDASEAASQPGFLQNLFAQILAILQDEPIVQNTSAGFLYALSDVWQRMRLHSSSGWRRRFVGALAESFSAYQWEVQNRIQHRVPPVAEYIDYRRKTGGWMTDLLLVDLALGHPMPDHLFTHPALQRMLDTANNVICWANDLYSFDKEKEIGDVHNLVHVVMTQEQCSVEVAIQTVVGWHNQEVQRWQHLLEQVSNEVPSIEFDHIQAYITFCEDFMASNNTWSQVTGRYCLTHPELPYSPQKTGGRKQKPSARYFLLPWCKGRRTPSRESEESALPLLSK